MRMTEISIMRMFVLPGSRLMPVRHQPKIQCHLMQGKKAFHASKLTVFERNSKKIINIEILKR